MLEVYRLFGGENADYSEEAKQEMYLYESRGIGNLKHKIMDFDNERKPNGFALGKKWATVNVAMWKQDIKDGLLFESELYREGRYPHWWLDEVLYGIKK